MAHKPTDNSTVDISGKVTLNFFFFKCFNFSMRCCMAHRPTDNSTVDCRCLLKNTSAVVEIEFERVVCVELYRDYKDLGRFMLRSGGATIAAGMVEEVAH